MKFTIQKSELHNALSITGRCISVNNIVPAMGMYRLKVGENELYVSTTDGERFLSYKTDVVANGGCDILLPAAKFKDYINDLPSGDVNINVLDKQVEIVSTAGKCKIAHEPGRDFPIIAHDRAQIVVPVESDKFLHAIGKVSFACADNKEPRIYFQGVYFEFMKSYLQLTATDAMVFSTFPLDIETPMRAEFILFKKSVETLVQLPVSELITMSIAGNSVQFTLNEQTIFTCILCAEKYPMYRSILPDELKATMTVNRLALLASAKRVSRFTYDGIELQCGALLKVGASISALLEEAAEEIATQYTGEEITLNVQAGRLISCLAKMESENVVIELTAYNRGLVLKESETEEMNKCMLVMPLVGQV